MDHEQISALRRVIFPDFDAEQAQDEFYQVETTTQSLSFDATFLGLIWDYQKAEKGVQIDRKRRRINVIWMC
jgi:hypothetical protein